jgi:hypothetical protein
MKNLSILELKKVFNDEKNYKTFYINSRFGTKINLVLIGK